MPPSPFGYDRAKLEFKTECLALPEKQKCDAYGDALEHHGGSSGWARLPFTGVPRGTGRVSEHSEPGAQKHSKSTL